MFLLSVEVISSFVVSHWTQDGTYGTIKGSCTVVRDFADMCYHSYPSFLKELRESPTSDERQRLR